MGVDLRRRGLPTRIWCGEAEGWREVVTDFRAWVEFDHGLQRGVAGYGIFPAGARPPEGDEWVASAREFLESPVACPHDSPEPGGRALDLVEDGDYLVAAFMQAYGVDLTDPSLEMHWHLFMALLRGLPGETVMAQAMGWRTWRDDRRDERARAEARRREWSLPDPRDEQRVAWQEAAFGRVAERMRRAKD